uniref:Uncharacterized protein n=1 Tax=Anguilla anguilla TaxID=7936 RepID=A0A0E9WAY4_ANGAN
MVTCGNLTLTIGNMRQNSNFGVLISTFCSCLHFPTAKPKGLLGIIVCICENYPKCKPPSNPPCLNRA